MVWTEWRLSHSYWTAMVVPVPYSNLMLLSTAYHHLMSATNAEKFHQNSNLWPHRDIFTKLPAVFSAARQAYSPREGTFPRTVIKYQSCWVIVTELSWLYQFHTAVMLLSTAYHRVMSATNANFSYQNSNLWPHRDIFTKLPAVFSAAQQVYSHREGPFPRISSPAVFSTARKAYIRFGKGPSGEFPAWQFFRQLEKLIRFGKGPSREFPSAADFLTAWKAYSLREGAFPRISSQAVFSTAPKPHHLGPNTSSQRTTSKHTLKHALKHTSEQTSEHSCYQVHIHQPHGFKLKSNKLNQKKVTEAMSHGGRTLQLRRSARQKKPASRMVLFERPPKLRRKGEGPEVIVLLDDGSDNEEEEDISEHTYSIEIPEKRKDRSINGSSTVMVCQGGGFVTLYVHAIMETGKIDDTNSNSSEWFHRHVVQIFFLISPLFSLQCCTQHAAAASIRIVQLYVTSEKQYLFHLAPWK